jgi:hypothetical protein
MHGHAACRSTMLRDTWRSYLPRGTSSNSSSIRMHVQLFTWFFEAAFGDLLVPKMDHVWYSWKA